MNTTGNILIVDDEKNIREGLKKTLELEGYNIETASNGEEAFEFIKNNDFDLVITDIKMPVISGTKLLEMINNIKPYIKVIMLTGHGNVETAVESMKKGAYDFFTKPVDIDKLILTIERAIKEKNIILENIELKKQLNEKYGIENIIGSSSSLKSVMDIVKQVAPTKATVLIEGESGTGKELIANAIHRLSDRADKPLVKLHCAALNENLLESELFGHEKGAFTGAIAMKKGRFELADGGTLFLDEIGEISPIIQVKLLRVLQEKEFERVGGTKTIKVDVRVITATNRDLLQEVQKKNFREDLYYRLKVVSIKMPPLRERKDDIPLLVNAFIKEFCQINNKPMLTISPKAMAILESYSWPGNIRELRNLIEGMVVLARGNEITEKDIPPHIKSEIIEKDFVKINLGLPLSEVEKIYILSTLKFVKNNKSKAAKILNIGRKTLHRKLYEYFGTSSSDDNSDENEEEINEEV
ncbi:MAG TPA: sigma-54 dependent transcriptional regulator [Spirochaetota bacterium]|nr:sigma-54 dependent transcriptional regulator [Spirochaetota bacterium]HOM37822.1 sigma-54 dependent transcriptional regulator [Spirochaetota bacterium]HPQ49301.1 sigma-54 dependent transcriptional regulator [Spirochaetota bacterium]